MKHAKQNSARLVKALDYRHMVDVTLRGRDKVLCRGYVLGIGSTWILLHETTAGGSPDATVAIRRKYISHVAKTKHFAAQVFAANKWPVPVSELGMQDLDSTRSVLRALGGGGALISVLRDVAQPAQVLAGSLDEVKKKHALMREVSCRGRWKRRAKELKLKRISRIVSGGDYLQQLALVAGAQPLPDGGTAPGSMDWVQITPDPSHSSALKPAPANAAASDNDR